MIKIVAQSFLRFAFMLMIAGNLLAHPISPVFAQNPPISLPAPQDVQTIARRVNEYWIANRPGPEDINWSRATYFTGNMAHYAMSGDIHDLDYAWQWAESFDWQLNGGCTTVYAEYHTVGQTYLALHEIDPPRADLTCLLTAIETSMSWGWLEVDLGTPININRIQLDTFQDRAYRYLVDVKIDAAAPYTMVLDRSDGKIGESNLTSTSARFVRLRVIGADGYDELRVSLNELQLFGTSDPTTNIALNRPVTCSSVAEPENGCTNVVDGDPATAWSALIPNDFSIESPK